MFFSAHVLRLKQSDSGVPSERGSVARLVGIAWKNLSAEDKQYYEREADKHNGANAVQGMHDDEEDMEEKHGQPIEHQHYYAQPEMHMHMQPPPPPMHHHDPRQHHHAYYAAPSHMYTQQAYAHYDYSQHQRHQSRSHQQQGYQQGPPPQGGYHQHGGY